MCSQRHKLHSCSPPHRDQCFTIKMLSFLLCFSLVLVGTLAEEGFSYDRQDQWPGICVRGNTMRQSPIDVIRDDVEFDDSLLDLELVGWDTSYAGTFNNTGITTTFTPTEGGATTRNHLGTYDLLQCHFHWGGETGEGAEHTFDGDSGELEVHFVHRKQNEDDNTAGDFHCYRSHR